MGEGMLKISAVQVFIVLAFASTACSKSSPQQTPALQSSPAAQIRERPRPASLPTAARPLLADLIVGSPTAPEGMPPDQVHVFYSLSCANGVLTIATTRETVYAELPCDRSPPDASVRAFLAQPAQIRFVAGNPCKLFVESAAAGTIEFTVPGMWIVAH
jgi:hypothetical protein